MEKTLSTFTKVLLKTTKMLSKVEAVVEKQPVKAFTALPKVVDNLRKLKVLVKQEGIVENAGGKELEEFKDALTKFNECVKTEEVKDEGVNPSLLKSAEMVEITGALEQLGNKING